MNELGVLYSDFSSISSIAALASLRQLMDSSSHPCERKQDLAGYVWTFSQTIADVDPADWGGVLKEQ